MSKISEILEMEKQRNEAASWNVIHLFKEGNFFRAYEWSAWLIVTVAYSDEVRKQSPDRKPLGVTRKQVKNSDDSFVFVGFPIKSLDKFIPYKNSFTPVNDDQIDIAIELPATEQEVSYEALSQTMASWKMSVPLAKENKKDMNGDSRTSPRGLTAIMASVLSYPLEQKTPMENINFISELKQQLAMLL